MRSLRGRVLFQLPAHYLPEATLRSFLDGLRLSPSPRALVLLGFVCPPCGPLSWLVLVAPPSVWSWFALLAWPVFCFVGFVWFRCVVRPWLVSLLCFAFGGFSSRHSGQVRLCYLLSPALLRPLS